MITKRWRYFRAIKFQCVWRSNEQITQYREKGKWVNVQNGVNVHFMERAFEEITVAEAKKQNLWEMAA